MAPRNDRAGRQVSVPMETFHIPMRRWMSGTLAADVTAAGLVASLLESGCSIISAEISPERMAYKQGWGMYYTTEWRIRWRDVAGAATLTTIDRDGNDGTEVSRCVLMLAAATTEAP